MDNLKSMIFNIENSIVDTLPVVHNDDADTLQNTILRASHLTENHPDQPNDTNVKPTLDQAQQPVEFIYRPNTVTGNFSYLDLASAELAPMSNIILNALEKITDNATVKQLAQHLVYKSLSSSLITTVNQSGDVFKKKSTGWDQLISTSESGPLLIFKEIFELVSKVAEPNATEHLALAIPISHMPYLLAKNQLGCSALEMLSSIAPNLQLWHSPELNNGNTSVTLLIADSKIYGKPGYFTWQVDPEIELKELKLNDTVALLEPKEFTANGKLFSITIPNYRLVITNHEQIAVLTGI